MQLTLVISSLQAGGAERVMSIMANYWVKKGWKITLLTFDDGKTPPFYELDTRIVHIPMGIASSSPNIVMAIGHNLTRLKSLRAAIRDSQPNAVISFIDKTNIITLLATRKLKLPVIVAERIDPHSYQIAGIWEILRKFSYSFAYRIVVQTETAKNFFSKRLQKQCIAISNPVVIPPHSEFSFDKQLLKQPLLISIGRLTHQKGQDILLKSFARIKNQYSEWNLALLGEGPLRIELESLRDRLGLHDSVHFLGQVKNTYQVLQKADIFVMSSRFEGFPNALCEAMACGLPVISTDCPSGPREIIRNEIDGLLIPNENVSALAAAMARLMSDASERRRLATRAPEVTERFCIEKVMEMWDSLLTEGVAEYDKHI